MPTLASARLILTYKAYPLDGRRRDSFSRFPLLKLINLQMTINPFGPLGIIQPQT
jgi:hypothetical protein